MEKGGEIVGAEFIEVNKAQGPQLDPSPTGVQFYSAYQQIWALAETYMNLYRKISWVKACVDIISDTATSEPAVIRMVDEQQELDNQDDTPRVKALKIVLDQINPNYDNTELANKNLRAMQINGTSYNRILRKAGGKQMVGLEYIAFTRVKPNVDDQGNITSWQVKSKRGSTSETVQARDIAVFKLPHPTDDVIGLSPLESLDLPTAVDIQAQRFNEAAFRNGPYASMVLSIKNADEREVTRNREYINTNFTKPENAHKPMILEGEIEVVGDAMMRRGIDGSFIELRKFNREEICAVYRVPTTKLITDGANRSNTEEHDETFIRDTVEPIQRLYWSQFNRQIIQGELGITDMYLAPGKKQDVNMAAVAIAREMVKAGATVNEARKVMNLTAQDDYDTPMIQNIIIPDDKSAMNQTGQAQQQPAKLVPAPKNTKQQPVQKATAIDVQATDTSTEEQEFEAAWIALMAQLRRRQQQAVSLHDLRQAWLPTSADVKVLSDQIFELYNQVWLMSYNRRRLETGGDPLKSLPNDVAQRLRFEADQTAKGVFETYTDELTNRMQNIATDNAHLSPQAQYDAVENDVSDWLKKRAIDKAKEIRITESGKAWNDGLFTHDEQYAPDAQYTVLPKETQHEACQEIIDGAPYTRQTIPADLPLHPRCPHRYYAITS